MKTDLDSIRRALADHSPLSDARPGQKRAAVAAVLRGPEEEPEVLLIRRATRTGDRWSGHMAFPGGRVEPTDETLEHTARRETVEEVGLDLGRHAELLGRLDDVPAMAKGRPAGITIAPFVYFLRRVPPVVTNEEVSEVLWGTLGAMARGELDTTRPYEHSGKTLHLPAFDVEGRIVWGLTHQMLGELFRLLR